MRAYTCLRLLLAGFSLAASCFGIENLTTGRVLDSSSAGIPGATIVVKTAQGTVVRSSSSDDQGGFLFTDLPAGSYFFEVSAQNFETKQAAATIFSRDDTYISIMLDVQRIATVVTVTASRGAVETVAEASQVVSVRERDEIVGPPIVTVAHALEHTPGVMLQETTYGAVSPHIRGLTGYQTLLLLDGIRFNTSIFRNGPNQYLGWIEPSSLERIEVALGPGGVAYGSDSMGGTINALSLSDRSGSRGLHGEVNVHGASADASGGGSARIVWSGNRVTWIAGGSSYRHNDLRPGKGEDSRNTYRRFFGFSNDQVQSIYGNRLQDTGFLRAAADSKLSFRLANDQNLTLFYMRSDLRNVRSYRDQYGGIGRIQAAFDPQLLNFGYIRYEKLWLGPLDSVSGTFSVNSQTDGYVQQNARWVDPVLTDDSYVQSHGYALQATSHIGSRQALVFGVESYDERISSYRFSFDPVTRSTVQQRALYPNGSRYLNSGYFIQDTVELIPKRLRATGGVRYTDVRYLTRAGKNINNSGVSLGVPDSSQAFRDLTFNTSLNWQINPIISLVGLVGRGFRAPNVNDLGTVGLRTQAYDVTAADAAAVNALFGVDGGDGAGSTSRRVGQLGAERLLNYELGVRFAMSRFYGRVQGFDAELTDPITFRTILFPAGQVPTAIGWVQVFPLAQSLVQQQQGVVAVATDFGPRAVKTQVNDGRGRYLGFESLAGYEFTSRWRIDVNYSFLSGRNLLPVRPVRRLPPQQDRYR